MLFVVELVTVPLATEIYLIGILHVADNSFTGDKDTTGR